MRVFIAGIDGYLGWPLAIHLSAHGHEVAGADLLLRRDWVEEVGSVSAQPIASPEERLRAFRERFACDLDFRIGDLTDYGFVERIFAEFQPEAVVHLGQMPSAPYSMIDQAHCVWTQQNNISQQSQLALGDQGSGAGRASGQARHDGRIRHA